VPNRGKATPLGGRRVLIIDDDAEVIDVIQRSLKDQRFVTSVIRDGALALAAIRAERPDLVLLDLLLPNLTGLEVCRRMKRDDDLATIPIIILTALDTDTDRMVGLELGADDYIVKPFNPREISLRVQTVLRRARPVSSRLMSFGTLQIDLPAREVTVASQRLSLTAREFDLLAALVRERGRPLSRPRLLREVWGHEHPDQIASRTVDVHVRRLRQKLGVEGKRLETLKNVGYRFAATVAG
jgi:DNA-binding response OmpR family regulator